MLGLTEFKRRYRVQRGITRIGVRKGRLNGEKKP